MGRQTAWILMKNANGDVRCIEPTAQPSYKKDPNWIEIGTMNNASDAVRVRDFLELGMPCDELTYLAQLYKVRAKGEKSETGNTLLKPNELSQLEGLCEKVRQETPYDCFAHCGSLYGTPRCQTCYEKLRTNWLVCAIISILQEAEPLREVEGEDG